MQKYTIITIITITILVISSIFLATKEAELSPRTSKDVFVRGVYGKHCYLKGLEHPNITKPLYFDSLEECKSHGK